MGKDTIGPKRWNSEDENWRTHRRSNSSASSPKKLSNSKGTSRVSSSSSLSSSSSHGHRREARNGSSSSSASSSRASSTTSVPKSASKESHQDVSSAHSHGHVSSGNSHTRRNKRMRTKPARQHHEEAVIKTSSSEAIGDRRHSPTSSGSSSQRKREDDKSRHRHESRGNRAERDFSWRRRSPTTGTSSTEVGHGSGKTSQRESPSTLDRHSGDKKVKHQERNVSTKEQKEVFNGSEEDFDFASDIFKDGGLKCTKSTKSNSASTTDLKKDARSMRLLKLSDERRKKEYLGYQPTYIHKLYSYGIDNKGKKEPQKTGLSKKEEDMMFRKRAVYMMHLEEERKRKEREEKEAERSGILKPNETNVKDISEKLKEALKRKDVPYDRQRNIQESEPERRETMVKETNLLLRDMEAALPVACKMETIPEALDEGGSSSDHDITNQNKHQFAEALNLCINPDKPHNSKCATSSVDTHLELESMESPSNQKPMQSDSEEFELETGDHSTTTVSDKDVSSRCGTNEALANADVTSDHDVGLREKDTSREGNEGYSKGPAAADEVMSDPQTVEVKKEGDFIGRHGGLPPVISDLHHKENGKVFAATRKDNVIRVSPETVYLHQQDSDSKEIVTGVTQHFEQGSIVCKVTSMSMKDKSTMKRIQGGHINQSSPETQMDNVFEARNPDTSLSNANTLPKPHATPPFGQDKALVDSVKNTVVGSGPSPAVTQRHQYARIAPAKTVKGIQTYVLPSASNYVQASHEQAVMGTSPGQIGPKGNMLSVFENKNQDMLQTGGDVYIQKTLNSVQVKPSTIQLSHGNRSFVNQVNSSPCLSVPPVVVLPNNSFQEVPSHVCGQNLNFDGSAFAGGGGGINSVIAAGNSSQPENKSNVNERMSANISNRKSAFSPVANVGVQANKSGQNETASVSSKSQGLLGYINVPVIKDDQGRLVMILPNDKTILGSTETQRGEVGKVQSKDVMVSPTDQVFHRDVAQPRPTITSVPKDVADVAAYPSFVRTKGGSSQATESSKSEDIKSTHVEKQINQVPSAISNANDGKGVREKADGEAGGSSQSTAKKLLENPCVGNNHDESSQSKSVEELRVRQKAITAKLKELRSVRVLIAKHGRMEEVECVRMVERLKQVEDLFFRQLIATSKELVERLKNGQQVTPTDAKETEGCDAVDTSARSKLVRDGNASKSADSNMRTSRTADSKMKRSDETVDKLFNTAHLLRNCISAMAKKRHARHERREGSCSVGSKVFDTLEEHGKLVTEVDRKAIGVESKTQTSLNAKIHNASPTSNVSTEQESDMSIGSPQVDQYHLQSPKSNTEPPTDKIVLRLQRVRTRDDSSSTSIDGAKNLKSQLMNGKIETDKRPQLAEGPSNSVAKTGSREHVHVSDGSDQFQTDAITNNDNNCTSQVATQGGKIECSRDSTNDSGTVRRSKVCIRDDSSNGSMSEGNPSRFISKQTSSKDKKYAVFTGPTKEQIREEDRREREMVKEAWNRVFPSTSSSQRCPSRNSEDSHSNDSESQRLCSKPRGPMVGCKYKHKPVKHVYGNPVIRGNLTSIGNINVTRQVGGTSETKFQWLLKQLQKKRNGGSQWKQKDQLRMQTSTEPKGEDGREYVSLISRGVQTRNSRLADSGNPSTSRKLKVAEQKHGQEEKNVTDVALPTSHNHSVENQSSNTKKRGRESTGSGGNPQEKLPRILSPTSDIKENGSTEVTHQNDDLQDLISLREEVLSRQSSSSEDTVEYSDNLISVEENVRRLKPSETEKKKLRSTGTMTAMETLTHDPSSTKHSKSRKFAAKTRGHGRYSWCKKKIASKMSKSKGSKKRTTSVSAKTKNKTTSAEKNAVVLISDDSLQEQAEEESPEKEKVVHKTRRSTLASLSARLWDECYWSTINDTSNHDVGAAKNILPSNNSPPTTRRTGLESKMMGLWSDLLRYSGNHNAVDTLPVALEDLDMTDFPPLLANSMKILLEGYNMVKQGSSLANQDSKSSIDIKNDDILNENNSAEIRVIQHNKLTQIPWEEPNKEGAEEMIDNSSSYDEESHVSSSTWEGSASTEFTLDTLTSHSANTVGSGPTYHSSSTTASPPSLSTEDGYVPVELPETNLRRWPTRMELASGTNGNGSISPDYSADIMNRNDRHEEGDSGRSGSERADALTVGTSGWQISGAGDLREPRLLTAPKATARNRRRQNRVMSWPNIVHEEEEEDPDDDIPLAKLIEKERLKRLQLRESAQDYQPLNIHPQVVNTDELDKETISSSRDSELPGPFLLSQSGLSDIPTDILDAVAEEKQQSITESKQIDVTEGQERGQIVGADVRSHPRVEQSDDIHPQRPEEHKPINHSSEPLARSGKFLYGHSKKGKALVKKRYRTSPEISQELSSNSSEAGAKARGRRFVVSCSSATDNLGNGHHLYYKSDSSPDIFD